ncbi:porin [Nitrospirillum iridis]|uniref:Putative porin n=1 Tax=Nitrospirillum iridis TaxID=765888 RepID=A0A7X0B109_9PROT|nr:porin [Nitrospirillum iridis]MBB6253685.1 putative porin [Nitrospirillum iridis]
MAKLLAKGILSQQEYDQLKQRKAVETPPPPSPAATAAASAAAVAATPAPDPFAVRMTEKGIGMKVGPVDVTLSGEINGFYVHDSPDSVAPNHVVAGGLAAVGSSDNSSIRNGLLPGNFAIEFKTQQEGFDIVAHFGMYPGLNSVSGSGGANSAGASRALATSGLDFRQQYLTVGTPAMGTVKVGRDIGLFGQQAILDDFTLFGVGSTGGNVAPSNTSLGRIGLGYVYTDFMPQITYTTPKFGGLTGSVGIFQPLDAFNFSGLSGTLSAHDEPQIQAGLNYELPADASSLVKAQLWTNVVTQSLKSVSASEALAQGHSVRGTGWDFGAKVDIADAQLVAYGYTGDGLGTTGLFFDSVSTAGKARSSDGYYFQGSYTFFKRFTLSGSYGLSRLGLASGEVNPLLVKTNESWAAGCKYKLTSWVNLICEYAHTTATAHGGNKAQEDTIAAGAIAFF